MVAMTLWDFVIGVLFGIIVSCESICISFSFVPDVIRHHDMVGLFFVIQNSQRESIRAFHTGEVAMSTVRRPGIQRAYIREVSKQTTILRLQGASGSCKRVSSSLNTFQGSYSSVRSHLSSERSVKPSMALPGTATPSDSSYSTFPWLQAWTCLPRRLLCVCSACWPLSTPRSSFAGFRRVPPLGRRWRAWESWGQNGLNCFRHSVMRWNVSIHSGHICCRRSCLTCSWS
jgi:hypothetical protein